MMRAIAARIFYCAAVTLPQPWENRAMKSKLGIWVLVAAVGASPLCRAAESVVAAGPKSAADEQKLLRVPPGFEVQLVASEPDIHKPINLAFDGRGRLWVTDTLD